MKVDAIVNEDCLVGLGRLADGSVDLAFADPPFNIGYEYDVYEDRQAADDYLQWCRQWIGQLHRVLKPDGTFWLAIGDEFAAELKLLAQREVGFSCRSWVVWYYTFGVNCTKKFSRSHAHLFHFVKDPRRFTFQFQRNSRPFRPAVGLWRWAGESQRPVARRYLDHSARENELMNSENTFTFGRKM